MSNSEKNATLIGEKISIFNIKVNCGSKAEKVLSLYNKIDTKIEGHYSNSLYTSPCKEGCSECCHDNFPISEIEFDLILEELKKWEKQSINTLIEDVKIQWNKMMTNQPKYLNKMVQGINDLSEYSRIYSQNPFVGKEYPCIFLDKSTNKCKIYNVRPLICRTHGTSYYELEGDKNISFLRRILAKLINSVLTYKVCSKIRGGRKAREWQANISIFSDDIDSVTFLKYNQPDKVLWLQPFPIIYYFYLAFVVKKTQLNIDDYKLKFLMNEEVYVETLFKRNNLL